MFKAYLTVLSFVLIGSSSAFADAKQDCGKLSGDAAIRACDQTIDRNPRDAEAHVNRGYAYFNNGDLDRAIADFSKAIEIDPKFAEAYNNRGIIFEMKGDFDRAIADSTTAIEIDPKYARAYSNRGNALMDKGGELDRAIADYTKAIEIDPLQKVGAHLNAYYKRGFAYQMKRDLDRAMTDYGKAIDVDPKHALAYIGRGFILRVRGDLDGAIADYTKAIEVDPKRALPYIRRAEAYQDKSDLDRAVADYARAIEIDPKSAAAYNSRCRFRIKASLDLPLALLDCDDAVRLAPNNATFIENRGFVYLKLNRLDEAVADYDAALKINPKLTGALYGRGLARQKKGDQAAGDADIAAAKAIRATIAEEFAKYGVN